jgi:hypothetical protein
MVSRAVKTLTKKIMSKVQEILAICKIRVMMFDDLVVKARFFIFPMLLSLFLFLSIILMFMIGILEKCLKFLDG